MVGSVLMLGGGGELDSGQGNQCRAGNRQNCLLHFHFFSPLISRVAKPGASRLAFCSRQITMQDDDYY
jgi:hypothetical protein